jgi:hypothetical protein
MKRNLWNCDRCKVEFEYSAEWGEQPINYVAKGGPPRFFDLCDACSALHERFLAGAPLAHEPSTRLDPVHGEVRECCCNAESVIEDL